MKIIYDKIDSVMVVDSNVKNLEETIIYIPNTYNFEFVNLYVDGTLVETKKAVSNKAGYKMYIIVPNKILAFDEGEYSVILQGVNLKDKLITSFNELSAKLNFDSYNEASLKYYSTKISENITEKYEKIYKLVELSAKIYESIKQTKKDAGDAK